MLNHQPSREEVEFRNGHYFVVAIVVVVCQVAVVILVMVELVESKNPSSFKCIAVSADTPYFILPL
jgi:hypothetical protein